MPLHFERPEIRISFLLSWVEGKNGLRPATHFV